MYVNIDSTILRRAALGGFLVILLMAGEGWGQNSPPALIRAVEGGDLQTVKALLEQGTDVDTTDEMGMTALMYAADDGHIDLVKLLLERGAQVNAVDRAGWSALMMAAQNGHADVVALLLSHGADVNMKNKAGTTALMWAATRGHARVVRVLLAAGADPDVRDVTGYTALTLARMKGHDQVVRLLEEVGARDSHLLDEEAMISQEEQLREAALNGDVDAVRRLLKAGVNPDARDPEGRTALMYAATGGEATIMELLLDAGADVNARDAYGSTALMEAALRGNAEAVDVLLTAGADVRAKNRNGQTALDWAHHLGRTKILKILRAVEKEHHDEERRSRSHPQILSVPRPELTDEARQHQVTGEVVLSAVLGADGVVRDVRVLRGLGYGLDEKAVEAVKKIRFIPAEDPPGHPIDYSMTIRVQFQPR